MLFSKLTAASATLLSVASATSVYWTVNVDDLDMGTKSIWCTHQISACTLLCLDQQSGGGFTNECDAETLQWQCICSDNTVPNATEYSQTIPYFLCAYQVENCVQNCGTGAPDCAQRCKTDKVCGATNPTRANETETESTSTSTSKKPTKTGKDGDDDVAFDDDEPSGTDADPTTVDDDDAPAETDGSETPEETNQPSAGARLAMAGGNAYAFGMVMISVIFGAATML